jgi:diacylglycerol kinase (ATP)
MNEQDSLRLLFIINPYSGDNTVDWYVEIANYFSTLNHIIELYQLPKQCNIQIIKERIALFAPHQVIAVGGDGTVGLVVECVMQENIPLGILPAGSANGLAKELGISTKPKEALDTLLKGYSKKIHLISINGRLCIHLSDIGLNAYAMKKFESQQGRGMWGYLIASLKVLWQNPLMEVEMQIDKKNMKVQAEMIVIANATKYGSGAVINPIGKMDDELFEVIVVKKISIREIFKMIFSHEFYDLRKTEVFQTNTLSMRSARKVHFQVDGEYLGKVNEVKALLIPDALEVIIPENL